MPVKTSLAPVTSQSEINLIVHADHWDPFRCWVCTSLSPASQAETSWLVRAFLPEARQAWVVDLTRGEPGDGRSHGADPPRRLLRRGVLGPQAPFPYRLRVENHEGIPGSSSTRTVRAGPDRFRPAPAGRGDPLPQLRAAGCPPPDHEGVPGVHFAVWAPNAQRVSVVGNFNHWDGRRHPMGNRGATGIWELFIPDLCQGEVYKYEVKSRHNGYLVQKSDPYGFAAEMRPKTASIVWDVTKFPWRRR